MSLLFPADPVCLPWSQTLRTGDIVSYRFPTSEPAPHKARPCLVLDIRRKRGKRYAVLAYGTSSRSPFNSGLEIALARADAAAAGLDRPTRFVGTRRVTVSLGCNRFALHPRLGSPVLGRLSGDHACRAARLRMHLLAEAGTLPASPRRDGAAA